MESEQWRIIRECHEGTGNSVEARAMSGHFGRDKTLAFIQSKVYFPSIRKKIEDYIRSCVACQCVKCGGKFEKGGEKLKSIPVPRLPWRQLGIDCITTLPPTDEGYDTMVTAIDYTSKWPECKALRVNLLMVLTRGENLFNQVCANSCSYTMNMYIFSLVYK